MNSILPDPAILRNLLTYDMESGLLFWKPRDVSMFLDGKHSRERTCAKWNTRFSGKQAFNIDDHGYRRGFLLGRKYSAHRVIWAICYGHWPAGEIDHIDGNPANNAFSNLRLSTHQQNSLNRKIRRDCTSGVKGISWHKASRKWRARIMTNGVRVCVGSFDSLADAENAICEYRTIAHGTFARHA